MFTGPAKLNKPYKEYFDHWLPPILGATGVTFGHNIFYDVKESNVNPIIRRHELIHVEQCERLTVVGFFVLYFYYYIKERLNGKDHWTAYRANPLEIEAYERQSAGK